MRAFIVDDEQSAITTTIALLAKFCPEVVVVGSAGSYTEAIDRLLPIIDDVQILFCDINLGEKTGFDLLDKLQHFRGFVVFISAHETYALRAYRYSPINYLTKPVGPGELVETMGRIKKREEFIAEEYEKAPDMKTLPVYIMGKWEIIRVDSLVCIQAKGSYSHIFILDQTKPLVTSRPLKYYEDKLKPNLDFVRIQKSYIINKKFISSISRNDSTVELFGRITVPIGGGPYKEIMKQLIS